MKAKLISILLVCGFLSGLCLYAQEQTPATEAGEDLDLYGVLELFRVAEDLEAFEKALNDEKSEVNNLDLDENGEVDFIRLEEHIDGNAHVIVLQVPLGENDYQDVATIEIEKLGEDDFTLQIVGNVELYGENFIIEPDPEAEFPEVQVTSQIGFEDWAAYEYVLMPSDGDILLADSYPGGPVFEPYRPYIVIVVGAMPVVRLMFRVGYRAFVSPWGWGRYPGFWSPWRVVARSIHRSRVRRFRGSHWRTTRARRSTRGRNMYQSRKRSSAKAVSKNKKRTTTSKKTTRKKSTPTKKKKGATKKTTTKKKKKSPKSLLEYSINQE